MSDQNYLDWPEDPRSRADQIFANFKAFHAANPRIWQLFKHFTLERIGDGFDHYSARGIFHRIRWEVGLDTEGDGPKLNNYFSPYYARMFDAVFPEHAGFFRNRRRTSEARPAYEHDETFHHNGRPGNEDSLLDELRRIADTYTAQGVEP